MILPVILDYNLLSTDKLDGLWIFYKLLSFAQINDYCIIGREIYFENPELYKDTWHLNEKTKEMYEYPNPNIQYLQNQRKYCISSKIEEKLEKENIKWDTLLKESCDFLEKEINKQIDKIEKDKGKKVAIILSWYPFYGLEKICKKRKIKLVKMEFTSIRKEWYSYTLGTISLTSKYKAKKEHEKYKEFDIDERMILSREELIILFSYKNHIKENLTLLKSTPQYELGYALGLDNDPYEIAFCKKQKDNIIFGICENYSTYETIFRQHPQSKSKIREHLNIDNSLFARQFICKCDKIVCNVSNIEYESMFFGRKVSSLNKEFLTSFGQQYNFNLLNDKVSSLRKLNFITFGIYTPFKLMFDKDYIHQIANGFNDINYTYMLHINKIFSDFKLDIKYFINLNRIEKKKYLLKKIHGFSDIEIEDILKITYNNLEIESLKKNLNKINRLNQKINEEKKILSKKYNETINICKNQKQEILNLQNELSNIYNSKGWKILKKIRQFKNKLKGEDK